MGQNEIVIGDRDLIEMSDRLSIRESVSSKELSCKDNPQYCRLDVPN